MRLKTQDKYNYHECIAFNMTKHHEKFNRSAALLQIICLVGEIFQIIIELGQGWSLE